MSAPELDKYGNPKPGTGADFDIEEDPEEDFYDSGNERDTSLQHDQSNSGLAPDEALEVLDLEDLMKEGRKMLLLDLVKLVKEGTASPQEKNTLRQMLKDNGMTAGDPDDGGVGAPQKTKLDLPEFGPPEYQ